MRIAVFSHSHPEIRFGGGEIAAYAHFQALKAMGHEAVFIAAVGRDEIGHAGPFGLYRGRADEVLWRRGAVDSFKIASLAPADLHRELGELIARFEPEVAHFHHYFGFSADCLDLSARAFGVPTVLTLHEYGAICAHHGQMKRRDGALCNQWSPADCVRCMPGRTPGEMFLRRERLLARLSQVERFIAPSRFLADRYAEWGIARERLAVIENILPVRARAPTPPRPAAYSDDRPLRLGYFGQFTPYKGLDVLLKAMNQLPAAAGVTLTIFGAANGEANRAWFEALGPELDKAGARVSLHGPYRNEDAGALLQTVDWVVAPSVWWENSPLVIQEARVAGVPVLVSHIGGMAEKVEPGVDGAHFVAGSSASLAERIMQIRSGALTATAAPIDPEAANAARLNDLCALYAGLTRAGEGA